MAKIWLCEDGIISETRVTSLVEDREVRNHLSNKELYSLYEKLTHYYSGNDISLTDYLPKEVLELIKSISESNLDGSAKQLIIREMNFDYERLLYYVLNVLKIEKTQNYNLSKISDIKNLMKENHLNTSACDDLIKRKDAAIDNSNIITLGYKLRNSIYHPES